MTVFTSPDWAPKIDRIDDNISIPDFILGNRCTSAPDPFVCGISGKRYSSPEVRERISLLSRAVKKELDIQDGQEVVVAIFSPNCIDYTTVAWAVQRLDGIVSPANATYKSEELAFQLKDAKAKALFTSLPVLETALIAARDAGVSKIYIMDVANNFGDNNNTSSSASRFKSVDDLIEDGRTLPQVEPQKWLPGYSRSKLAYLCYSSGTSGKPKGVLISHKNVVANVLQISSYYSTYRKFSEHSVIAGVIPFSHIYSLVVINHMEIYNGSSVVVLPKFDLESFLRTVERFRIQHLYIVPPIIITLVKNKELVEKYDISCIKNIFTGAAPFSEETSNEAAQLFPKLTITQAYGMTECSTVVSMTSTEDIWHGSSGCVVPEVQCKIISPEGKELGEGEIGELCIKGPNVTLGYLNNAKATAETFQDGWLRSGDEACFKRSKKGNMHLFVVDRLKDLVKVNGMQVAPAELEGHILNHPSIADVAVIGIPDEKAGEVPKACVVLKPGVPANEKTIDDIKKFVADHKARHKHLGGGISFINVVPRNPSGKILRRMLRDAEKEKRRKEGAKL